MKQLIRQIMGNTGTPTLSSNEIPAGGARAADGLGRLAAESSRKRNVGAVSSAPTLFMMLSTDASAGRVCLLPAFTYRFFGAASLVPRTSTRILRF